MIENLLSANTISVAAWQLWGVAIAFAVTAVTTCWIFFDSQRNALTAPFWRLLSLLAAMIVTPSATLRLYPHLQTGLPPALLSGLALAGSIATVVSFFGLILYALGVGVRPQRIGAPALEVDPLPPIDDPAPTLPGILTQPSESELAPEPPAAPEPDPEPEALAWLVITSGPNAAQTFRLAYITDIGRDECCNDIHIADPSLSRQHARIRWEDGAFVIYDLASANGVTLNAALIQRAALHDGDRLQMGQTQFALMQVQTAVDADNDEDAAFAQPTRTLVAETA